jgi:O-antigen/teichoic acid export membrane protein
MQRNLSFYTFFYLISLVLMRICGILAKILLARSITPYEYGLITLIVLAIPGAMQLITNFCFFDILGHATEGKKYLGISLIYGSFSTVFLAIIFFVFRADIFTFLNIPKEYWEISYILLFVVLFTVTIRGMITGYLRGIRNHVFAATFSAEPSIIRILFIVFGVYLVGIDNFYAIFILFALPPLITLIPVIIFKFQELRVSLKSILLPNREMAMFGFSFFILTVWLSLSLSINSVIISHDLGIVWQGYWDVSLSMVTVITFFSSAIYLVSAPETTLNNNRSELLLKPGGFGDIGKILLSMCLLCVLIIYFYSYQLITLLFTKNYAIASDYLIILAIGYTVLFIQQYCAFLNISTEGDKNLSNLSLITIFSIIIFPFFTHFMILYFGFMGAYLATTIFIILFTIITMVMIEDRTPLLLLLKKIDRLILSVFGTFLILYLLHLPLIPGILTSLVLFTLLIFSLGYVDWDILWDIARKKRKMS